MPKGVKGFKKGHKHSKETIEKLRIASKNNPFRRHSEESKKKIGLAHKGKIVSEQTKLKISNSSKNKPKYNRRGASHHWWKGGITKENLKIRMSLEYKLWRKAVFERDNFECIWCGYTGNKLQADHIKPFSLFPELRFAIDNGRTLCIDCHKTTDSYGINVHSKKK